MQRRCVSGIEPIPRSGPLKEAVRRLHQAGLAPQHIAAELQRQNVLSRRRRPATERSVLYVLWKLGLRPKREAPPALARIFRSRVRKSIGHYRTPLSGETRRVVPATNVLTTPNLHTREKALKLICDECHEKNPALMSCVHTFTPGQRRKLSQESTRPMTTRYRRRVWQGPQAEKV
jgi:hypothetical protein